MKKIALIILVLLLVGCQDPRDYKGSNSGVTFTGNGLDGGKGTLTNTNGFPVRIHAVVLQYRVGENTQFIIELQPEEKYHFSTNHSFTAWGFYIRKSGSTEVIGFFSPYWVEE